MQDLTLITIFTWYWLTDLCAKESITYDNVHRLYGIEPIP